MNGDDGSIVWSINSSAVNDSYELYYFNCSSASSLLKICTSRYSFVKSVFVPAVCVVGIIGNLLTL